MSNFTDSLLKWLKTFDVIPSKTSVEQLCDGVAIAKVLSILAPDHFNGEWLAKIKGDISTDNWRVKVSNLRKILDNVIDWYTDVLCQNIATWRGLPDINAIGKDCNHEHLGRMLQLVIGIAVQCNQKKEYIDVIMRLEEEVQLGVMQAVQEIMIAGREGYQSLIFPDSLNTDQNQILKDQLRKLQDELRIASEGKEIADQKYHELEKMVNILREEKDNILQENDRLVKILEETHVQSKNTTDPSDASLRDRFFSKLQNRVADMEDDLYRMEVQRDEFRAKNEVLEKELMEMRLRNEDLARKAKETRAIKDELDALKHLSEKAEKYEQSIQVYKAKLEEMMDLKRQVKSLEDRNSSLVKSNLQLEEELKRSGALKTQLDLYKKQIQDLHQEVLMQTHRADQAEFDAKKYSEKSELLKQERAKLVQENSQLKYRLDDNRAKVESTMLCNSIAKESSKFLYEEISRQPNQAEELKEKIVKLEHENELLREKLRNSDNEKVIVLQTTLEDAKERMRELENENRIMNRNVIELKSHLKDLTLSLNESQKLPSIRDLSSDGSESDLRRAQLRIKELESALHKKDQELTEIEAKYKTYVSKARQAVKNLEPLSLPCSVFNSLSGNSTHGRYYDDLNPNPVNDDINNSMKVFNLREVYHRLGKRLGNSQSERDLGKPSGSGV